MQLRTHQPRAHRARSPRDVVKFPFFPFALTLLLAPMNPLFAAADANEMVKQSVDTLGLQTEMPDPVVKASDHWFDLHISPELIRFMLWGTVIAGILVIVWSLRDSLPVISRSRKIIAPEAAPPSVAQSNRMDEAQVEADDLARQGHYGEAMHVLLLKSLNELRRQLGISFAVSLTSREILRRVQLPDIGRQSLTAIIRSVERTYFGGEDAGQNDYSNCRSNFETLKHSLATVAAT
jgi:hypothetical protein